MEDKKVKKTLMCFLSRNGHKKLYAFDDTCAWGRKLAKACRRFGIRSSVFNDPSKVPNLENAYIFLNMQPGSRDDHFALSAIAEEASLRDKAVMIPKIQECRCIFDKRLQAEIFAGWMPKTWIMSNMEEAKAVLSDIKFPFISKSRASWMSKNVRLIRDEAEACREIAMAFSDEGIPVHGGRRQKGYLLWQEFIGGNEYEWRVILVGNRYAYAIKRFFREDVPFASGSGKIDPVKEINDEITEIFDFVRRFSEENRLSVVAADLLRDTNSRLVVIENHCAWGRENPKHREALVFEFNGGSWVSTGRSAEDIFELMARAIHENCFAGRSV